MKKFCLCPPTYYDIQYSINPWMHIGTHVDQKKVKQEYAALKNLFDQLGAKYFEMQATDGLPDQVYTTDTGHPQGKLFIRANFRYGQRKPESAIAAKFFEGKGFAIYHLPPNVAFEGGDLLKLKNICFMGYGPRTSYEAEQFISPALDCEVVPIKLINQEYFHLDTCLTPLLNDVAMYYPAAFTDEGKQTLDEYFEELIEVDKNDAQVFACNLITYGKHILVNEKISDSLKKKIASYGFTVHGLKMHEYLKGGGSVKCICLQMYK